MSATVDRLEELLARVQRNRAKPRRRHASTSARAPGVSRRPHKPTPLEMAVEVELDRPKVQPSAARVRPPAAVEPSPPVAAEPAAPPAAAKPVAAPGAAKPVAAAEPSPPPAAVERPARLKAVAIEAPPLASAKPVVESAGEVPSPLPATFGELMGRTLALRPK